MSKTTIILIFGFCFLTYAGFALDLFYPRSVYDFDSCVAYSFATSTHTIGECLGEDGVIYRDHRSYIIERKNEGVMVASSTVSLPE